MPTAILDIDLRNIPGELQVPPRYTAAMVLVRLDGVPLCGVTLPVKDGRVLAPDLADTLIDACGMKYW
jgi:hypothetical protein